MGTRMVTDMAGIGGGEGCAEMQRELMAEKVEIDPCICAAPFGAAQKIAVKGARFGKVGDVIGKVKYRHGRLPSCVAA